MSSLDLDALEARKLEAEISFLESRTVKNQREMSLVDLELEVRERRLQDEKASLADAHVFHFFGPVTSSNCGIAIEELGTWSRRDPECDITVVFNSPGGSVWEGLALYDFLRDLRNRGHKVVTKSIGMAASMGGILLQAGDERVISKHGFVLIHEISQGMIGKMSELEDSIKLSERLQDKLLNILSERSTMTKTQIKRAWKRKDYWIDAEEALRLQFVDRIEE